jgi:phage gpG-like protein
MASKIRGMSELKRAFQDLAKQGERNQRTAINLVGQEYSNDVKAKITEIGLYKKGDYRRSVHVESVSNSSVVVGTNRIDGRQHEYGGVIKAKNAPYLVFQLEDGTWVQKKQVYQPPHPHFRNTLDENWQKYQRMYLEALGIA